MSLTPEQREAMDLALGLLVTIHDAGYYRDKINEALPRLRAALSQEPEQPISAPAQELYGIRVSPQQQPVSASAIKDPEQPAAEGGLLVDWRDNDRPPNCPCIENDDPIKIVWRDETGRRCTAWRTAIELGDLVLPPISTHTNPADPSKKPENVDTSGPHVDGVDTLAADARDAARLRHACWLGMQFPIHRYLMSCTHGRWSGAEKAQRHAELCSFMIAAHLCVRTEDVSRVGEHAKLYKAVRESTLEMTDNLDDYIEFPINSDKPDYDELAPKFFDHFYRLARVPIDAAMQSQADVREDGG